MQIRFDDKTIVVSGTGHGFGRFIAETFAQLGARVFGWIYPPRNLRKPRGSESKQKRWT